MGPWSILLLSGSFSFLCLVLGHRLMQPHPRIDPRLGACQGVLLYGQSSCARDHTSWVLGFLHFVSMWSIDSIMLQVLQCSLSSNLGMCLQRSPTLYVLWIDLYMNCWINGLIVGFHRLFYIAAFVSILPVNRSMALWVSCRFISVEFLGSTSFLSRIPLYAFTCVSVDSFAPCMSNSIGMSSSSASISCLFTPCLAKQSLSSFPMVPLCPFVYWKVILADWCLSVWAAFLNNMVFSMLIHLSFSQDSRWLVSLYMVYFESVTIFRGWYGRVTFAAAIIATSSPTWFDWATPGTLMARFLGFLCPNHTPLLLQAFCFPLFMHALSV